MALFAWSFLVAGLSFLCYRHPPQSWPYLWGRYFRPVLVDEQKHDAPEAIVEEQETRKPSAIAESQEDIDRKAMPPPNFKKPEIPSPKHPSPQLTPKASATKPVTSPSVPSFTLSEDDDEEPSVPSFPAANSAQRASGGRMGPPRLNPLPNPQSNLNARNTNATASLMSPPARSPFPNRTPNSNTGISSLAPPPTHTAIPSKPRKKVLLTPGHSPLDWARLTKSPSANLRGLPPSTPFLRVPPSLLKKYNGRRIKTTDGYVTSDAWTSLSGKVYNITPYLPYHPGGEPELLKAAGRDGTKLFGEVHPWVNWEGMLEECLIGFMVEEGEGNGGQMEEMD